MKAKMKLTVIVMVALFFVSCGGDLSNLKEIRRQKVGDFNVLILNQEGAIKQGEGSFVVEFRNAQSNKLVEVGSVTCEAVMQMAGMPMTGESTINFTDIPGRYDVKYNFSMKGNWLFTVDFNNKYKVQFTLNVV